jgi:tRNA(Ile)-lysidine synthase TilS/MesJ
MLNVIYNNKHLNILDKDRPLVLALSGGVDSMVLFDLLKNAGYKVVIAHVNHHKRAESEFEEAFIRNLAKKNNFDIEVLDYIHEKDNFHAAAHNSRY